MYIPEKREEKQIKSPLKSDLGTYEEMRGFVPKIKNVREIQKRKDNVSIGIEKAKFNY